MADTVRRFRKKPVEIEAMQLDGTDDHAVYLWAEKNSAGSFDFTNNHDRPGSGCGVSIDPSDGRMVILTLEGAMHADPGDWIIRGVQGEFYPCKPDIFAATYVAVEADDPAEIRWTCDGCQLTWATGDLEQTQPDGRYCCPNCTDTETHLIAVPVGAQRSPHAAGEALRAVGDSCPRCGWVNHPWHTDAELDAFDCDHPWHDYGGTDG